MAVALGDIPEVGDAAKPCGGQLKRRLPGTRLRARARKPSRPLFVCRADQETIHGLLAQPGGAIGTNVLSVTERDGGDAGKYAPIVVLPRDAYLTRVVRLPRAQPSELRQMIRLEAEATLPPDYGPVEVSFRELEPQGVQEATAGNIAQYEIYLAKESLVERCVERMRSSGLFPQAILPSAMVWALALDGSRSDPDTVLLADAEGGHFETAHRCHDGSVAVRSLSARSESDLRNGLMETLRASAAACGGSGQTLTLGWLGTPPPALSTNGHVRIIDRTARLYSGTDASDPKSAGSALLRLAASVLADHADHPSLSTANLVPRSFQAQREERQVCRHLGVGIVCFLGSLVLLVAALEVGTWRYEREVASLGVQIATIQTDGEAVGERLAQLEAVAAARSTRDDFARIVGGLHDASPKDGLSYSQVDLREDATLLLRGQADSLALPFELPQRLEELPALANVVLRDAGQAKKGAGSVTEFRIEAAHRREGGAQ